MTTSTIDRARLEELLGEYWEIAFEESSGVVAIGNKANRVLHEIRALFYALAAPATAPDELERLRKDAEQMREALMFYAEGDHFTFDRDAWDTVSDEPQNYWCDEAGTATVEDGTIAKLALDAAMKGTP
jgi:hypothetical protein